MNVKFRTLRLVSFGMIILGFLAFGLGYALDAGKAEHYVEEQMNHHPEKFSGEESHHASVAVEEGHAEHVKHLLNQFHNRPWSALLIVAFMFTGISASSLFFLSIQNVSQAGWPVVVFRVMESIASFLPYAAVFLFLILLASYFHLNHIYHWMDPSLVDLNSPNYDKYIDQKSIYWLDANWWIARAALYLSLWSFFSFKLRALSRKLDETSSKEDYWKQYKWSVVYIAVYSVTTAAAAFEWIMSIDPHWYSTLFMWYNMVSYLVCAISIMALISIYLKSENILPNFSRDHQHDLAKFMFGFSMLWTYLWFCQFMLIWYANIPEESAYFWARNDMYGWAYYGMLITNFLLPLFVLVSSDMKRVKPIVVTMGFIIVLGHFWDFFNQVAPGSVGPFANVLGLYEVGAFLMMSGAFIFVVFRTISKTKSMEATGHPMYVESKQYEYPF